MVVLHQPKDVGSRGPTYAKFLLDLPLRNGLSFRPSEEAEDLGLYRGDGILHFLTYSFFEFTAEEIGENLEGQDNMLVSMGHRFSSLLIVSLLTIIVKKPLFA
jgi:hypothetical protein